MHWWEKYTRRKVFLSPILRPPCYIHCWRSTSVGHIPPISTPLLPALSLVSPVIQVCVVGDDVRVCERPSLPDLPPGLTGSFSFDSQKPYPTLAEVSACGGGVSLFVDTYVVSFIAPYTFQLNLSMRWSGLCAFLVSSTRKTFSYSIAVLEKPWPQVPTLTPGLYTASFVLRAYVWSLYEHMGGTQHRLR